MSQSTRQGGFTLIEVLVAFVILVMALPVLYGIFSAGLRGTALAEDYRRALAFGESRLAELGVSEPLQPGETQLAGDGGLQWRVLVSDYRPWPELDATRLAVKAYQVTLEIGWQADGQARTLSLSTVKLARTPGAGG